MTMEKAPPWDKKDILNNNQQKLEVNNIRLHILVPIGKNHCHIKKYKQ